MSRTKQRLGGLLLAALSAAGTAWNWHLARTEGYFWVKASIFLPACLVLGLAMILFPSYRAERLSRGEDITKLQGWRLITPRWWAIVAVALAVGLADYLFLNA